MADDDSWSGKVDSEASVKFHMQSRKRKRKSISQADASALLSGSSSSSSDDEEDAVMPSAASAQLPIPDIQLTSSTHLHQTPPHRQLKTQQDDVAIGKQQPPSVANKMQQPEGWRVKLYRLNSDGSWDDCGTGRIVCLYKPSTAKPSDSPKEQVYQELGEPTLCMRAEANPSRVLLRTRILLQDAYQRQGENIITWCEPYFEDASTPQSADGQPQGVDLALSFQDNSGCLHVWRQITAVQSRANDRFRTRELLTAPNTAAAQSSGRSATDVAQAVAAAHHATLQRQQQQSMWMNVATEAAQHQFGRTVNEDEDPNEFREQDAEAAAVSMAAAAAAAYGGVAGQCTGIELPQHPNLQNLTEIADIIASAQLLPSRDSLSTYLSQSDCSFVMQLLQLFEPAEAKQDYGALATLAACIKSILLLNEPSIIEWVVNDATVFESVCASLEYDPDLREKANHRWFLRQRAKFRTVLQMEDEDLVNTIHRAFRVTYLRDTLLRPTMDESSLSTLSSLQTFTHADVVKGVMGPLKSSPSKEPYVMLVLRLLGREVEAISMIEWQELETGQSTATPPTQPASVVREAGQKSWKQHVAPQDDCLASRKIRRRGCVTFFRELFNMVRLSLQQSDKDDFYGAIVCMEVDLHSFVSPDGARGQKARDSVNLLSLLAAVLSDPVADITEKSAILEILGTIALHDPNHIRRHCLDFHQIWQKSGSLGRDMLGSRKPLPNERNQILFRTPPNDLLASLLSQLATASDAGVMMQSSEILRLLLDTDMLGDHGTFGQPFGNDESSGVPPGSHAPDNSAPKNETSTAMGRDQNQFLTLFYEHYIQWLVGPFQHEVLIPERRLPDSVQSSKAKSSLLQRMIDTFKQGVSNESKYFLRVSQHAIRGSFSVELLSFCVRTHRYRMKFFLLKSRVLSSIMRLLNGSPSNVAGDRCLNLAVLRFLRAIVSVKDEFYNRHIIQHNLFEHVFDAFRTNPIGDNVVSSAIVEMCDFVQKQNVTSLVEYIATRHLASSSNRSGKSLEDVATPYVSTLTTLRKRYEENISSRKQLQDSMLPQTREQGSRYFAPTRIGMNEKAMEDQRKFREADAEESYFGSDESSIAKSPVVNRIPLPSHMKPPSAMPPHEKQQDSPE